MNFTELRVRSKIHPDQLEAIKGKVLADTDYDVLLKGPTKVFLPDGRLMAQYLPGYFDAEHMNTFYEELHFLKRYETTNRGLASGTPREKNFEDSTRTYSLPVASAIVGAVDPGGQKRYCRLTAFTGRETERYSSLIPLFQEIGDAFAANVPDRYQSQMAYIKRTAEDWVVPGTPFTTITVNNSYPTGVHTDSGDLDEGFSNLAVLRRGDYSGGIFVFAEYRIGVDMHDGDLILMDAHQWHGNTFMRCNVCREQIGPPMAAEAHDDCFSGSGQATERISIVCYYRTRMEDCGTADEERERALKYAEKRNELGMAAVEEMATESAK